MGPGIVTADALPPITMKGINREVIPYLVKGLLDATGHNIETFSEMTVREAFNLWGADEWDALRTRFRG